MPFSRVTACLTVDQRDQETVVEALQNLIDSFLLIHHLTVFDSEVTVALVCDPDEAEDERGETKES